MLQRIVHPLAAVALTIGCLAPARPAAQPTVEALHANAVASFQRGRYAEAYGRFMALADAGYAPSADVALFMYANGPTLFAADWDVTPDQLASWARLVGRPVPEMVARANAPRSRGAVLRSSH